MARLDPTVWERLDYRPTLVPTKVAVDGDSPPATKVARWKMRVLDSVATTIWGYALARVFVGDVDRWALSAVSLQYAWLLDFRFFGFLLILTVALGIFRRKRAWVPIYVVLFPIVVVLWKVPKFLYKRRSMTLFMGFVHATTAMFLGFRRTALAATVGAFAILGIAISSAPVVLLISALALLGIWAASLARGVKYALAPTKFVQQQRSLIERLLASTAFWRLVTVDDNLAKPTQDKLSPEQTNQFLTAVSSGMIGHRLSQFWAQKLDNYRRSNAFVIFAAFAVLGLFFLAAVTFTGVNIAVYKADPGQFAATRDAGVVMFAYYSIASMYVSEIAAITPIGPIAAGVSIIAAVSSALILFLVVTSLIFGYRQSRNDESAIREIYLLRKNGDSFANRLADEYEVSLDSIAEHLNQIGFDFLGILGFLTRETGDTGHPRDGAE